jgi:methanogenic corrinoid protein MtbC1
MDADQGPEAPTLVRGLNPGSGAEQLAARFIAEPFRTVADAADRRARIADLVWDEIVPRLNNLGIADARLVHPSAVDVAELARLILGPDDVEATRFVAGLRQQGLTVDVVYGELLEPAAQLLGRLWDQDEVDFIDVTLGVGRLQALMAMFSLTHEVAVQAERRRVLMLTVPGEQHGFGITMVERFLEAGGWQVTSERELPLARLAKRVEDEWFAVVGLTLSSESNFDKAAAAVAAIRAQSCNRDVGVMVGGPVFSADPHLAARIGADGTAASAPAAVVLAQRLLDEAIAAELRRSAR